MYPAEKGADHQTSPGQAALDERGQTWPHRTARLGSPRAHLLHLDTDRQRLARIFCRASRPEAASTRGFGTYTRGRTSILWGEAHPSEPHPTSTASVRQALASGSGRRACCATNLARHRASLGSCGCWAGIGSGTGCGAGLLDMLGNWRALPHCNLISHLRPALSGLRVAPRSE